MTNEGRTPFSNQVPTTIALAGQPANIQIHIGFEMEYDCPLPTPMLMDLSIHHSRAPDLVRPDLLLTSPAVPVTTYYDQFGNWCSRIVTPLGRFVLSTGPNTLTRFAVWANEVVPA
jgi:hypothetical protein